VPTADPALVQGGTPGGDPRGTPGADRGSGVRPGGTGGEVAGDTGGGEERTGPGGGGQGGEGQEPSGGRGLKGGSGTHELPWWLSWVDTALDVVQVALDIVGLIPGLGEIADGINGLLSLARGDYAGAALSFAAMIPFAGWAATAGKFGRRAVRAANIIGDAGKALTRYGDRALAAGRAIARRFGGTGRAFRTFVGDSGLFMERVPALARKIGDDILGDAANRVLVTPQVLRELLLPKNVFRLTEAGAKARRSAIAQFRRLTGSAASVRVTLSGGMSFPRNLLTKAFGTADLATLNAAARRGLAIVTTDGKLLQQAKSIPGVSAFLGKVPDVFTIGKEINSAADVARLIP
jgi:hypothetical protein